MITHTARMRTRRPCGRASLPATVYTYVVASYLDIPSGKPGLVLPCEIPKMKFVLLAASLAVILCVSARSFPFPGESNRGTGQGWGNAENEEQVSEMIFSQVRIIMNKIIRTEI